MSTSHIEDKKDKKKFQMPHIYVILFFISAIVAIATYFIPAGEYERVPGPEGRTTIDPNSYTQMEQTPVGMIDFLTAIPRGLIDAGEVVFFTFIIGGLFVVLRQTGIIEIGVEKLTRAFSNKSILLIPVLMTVFAVIATLIGTAELSLVYIPVILPLIIALGYDSLLAAAIPLIGTVVGFTVGVLNPINTGLGQKISGIPVFSGIGFRFILLIVVLTVSILYIMRYARKIEKNPMASITYEEDMEKRNKYQGNDDAKLEKKNMTKRQIYASVTTFLFFGILVYGVLFQGWFMIEMSGLFISMGVVVGLIAGLTTMQICEGFNQGFRDVLVGAIIVGVARAVAVIMEDGNIMDTIVYGLGLAVNEFPSALSAVGMYFVQLIITFFIPSGSGQALVTMPIMAPLSDLIGMTRQTAVLAFQLGDGFAHIFFPTTGYFMASLVLAGVPYQKWLRFFTPLFLIFIGISSISLIIAQVIQWT